MQNDGNVSALKQFFRNKWVRVILVADVLAIIATIGVLIWNATKTATINFSIAPIDAKIQIDGHGEYYNGSYNLHPGNYTVSISHDNLVTKTFNLELKSGYDTTITAFLTGENGNLEFYTLKDNFESFQKLAQIASKGNNATTDQDTSAESFIQNFQQAYALWQSELPIRYAVHGEYGYLVKDVTIRANYNCIHYLCIEALMRGTDDEDLVSSLLEEKGFNLEEYEIEYKIY